MKPYIAFARASFLNMLAYKARYFVGILTYFFNVTVWYYIWRALFSELPPDGRLGGFTFSQMLTYVATGWVLRSFYFNEIDRDLANQVQEGRLSMTLLKPVDFQAMTIVQALGESLFRAVFFALPIGLVVFLVYPLSLPVSVEAAVLCLISGVLSALLVGAINFSVGLIAIRTHSILGFLRAKYMVLELLSGLLLPPVFFPEAVRPLLSWLPFMHMNFTPGRIYLGLVSGYEAVQILALQAVWVVALLLLGRFLWKRTARHIESMGG